MSADFITLFLVLFITSLTIIKRVSAQVVILVLLSGLLVSLSVGAGIVSFLSSYSSLFDTANAQLAIFMGVAFIPTTLAYWHLRGGAKYNPAERFVVAVFFALLCLVAITSLFEVSGLDDPFRNSYFANQINQHQGIITFAAFVAALFEVLSQSSALSMQAKRGRRRMFSRRK